mmetsp:Transcript_5186/g.7221  ORF Transcript_5186/g.7221 Transcript_5186/m.7221 type:complete len:274 (-) Transcript_5186:410-1231(-)
MSDCTSTHPSTVPSCSKTQKKSKDGSSMKRKSATLENTVPGTFLAIGQGPWLKEAIPCLATNSSPPTQICSPSTTALPTKTKKTKTQTEVPVLDSFNLFGDEDFSHMLTPPPSPLVITPPTPLSTFEEAQLKKHEEEMVRITKAAPLYLKMSSLHPCDDYFLQMVDRLRCKKCQRMLCCGESGGCHGANCWVSEFIGVINEKHIIEMNKYQFNVMAGKLSKYSHYLFGFFNRAKHVQIHKPFNAARLGLFVRCMLCVNCSKYEYDCCVPMHYH